MQNYSELDKELADQSKKMEGEPLEMWRGKERATILHKIYLWEDVASAGKVAFPKDSVQ